MPTSLTYDVVMATRNRPEAVALSIPLILAQTRKPERIVIVDSSDDGAPIAEIAAQADGTNGIPVEYHRADPGLTLQRNLALTPCSADIVLFPDDDSLLYRETAAIMMAAYEADTEARIAAICAAPVTVPPPECAHALGTFEAETVGPVKARLRGLRQRVKEAAEAANPFLTVGNALNAGPVAALGPDLRARVDPVPYMTGFRMSFRRAVIAGVGFDENLRRYAWFEDIDASWGAMRAGAVVVARGARIYHHRAAAARAGGYRMGLWAILNRGYVVMKHVHANPDIFPDPTREARRLKLACRGRALAYRAMARDAFGRDRARGAAHALGGLAELTAAPPAALLDTYRRLEAEA
jgi:glycosyltransferase involved in cell wall biosynthesis